MTHSDITPKPLSDSSHEEPDIVIEGGILITMVDGEDPINPARVCVKHDRIVDVQLMDEAFSSPANVEIIDASDCIIMPGLINCHCHTPMTLFRGAADDLPLKEWLYDRIFPMESEHLRPETVYWGSLLGCIEMIASGTTSFMDGYFFEDDTVQAVHRSGLRAHLAQGVIDFPAPGVSDPAENLIRATEFIEKWADFSELISPGIFCHSPSTCSDKTLRGAMEISRDYSLPLQIHLSETSDEVDEIINKTGQRPVRFLNKLDILDEGLVAAHAVHLTQDEIELLAEKGVRVVHVPESNMKLSSGVARVAEMLRLGMKVGLGTDGCASNNDLDLFQEMDTAAKLGKVSTGNPVNMDAAMVLRMATSWGGAVLGIEQEVGTIEKGKKADIIVVDLQSPHLVPLYNPFSSLVYSANGADVRDVIVDGQILLRNRVFQTLDPDEIMAKVRALTSTFSLNT
jgi:5-methylthioadenosine/S-adenosylhomocysteine deaminase